MQTYQFVHHGTGAVVAEKLVIFEVALPIHESLVELFPTAHVELEQVLMELPEFLRACAA